MLRKAFAACLVALAFSPFTEPFTTCDLTTLFAASPVDGRTLPPKLLAAPGTFAETALQQVLPAPAVAARARFVMSAPPMLLEFFLERFPAATGQPFFCTPLRSASVPSIALRV